MDIKYIPTINIGLIIVSKTAARTLGLAREIRLSLNEISFESSNIFWRQFWL